MKHPFKLFVIVLLFSCNAGKQEDFTKKVEYADSLKFSIEANNPIDKSYKKRSVHDQYSKREYIDSLYFHVIRVYFKSDTNQLDLETIDDLISDTSFHTWYHENGQIKKQEQFTYHQNVPFGTSIAYDINGNITEKIDHEVNYKIKLRDAIHIGQKKGLKQPFEIDLSDDSLSWEILIWKTSNFDTINNHGISTGKGLSINRMSGKIKEVEKKREWEI